MRIPLLAFAAPLLAPRSVSRTPLRAMSTASVGFKIPDTLTLMEDSPGTKYTTGEIFKGKKVVLFGLPGAFTPGCSKTHLPGYIADFEKFKAKGVDDIVCVTINDPFVTGAWANATENCRGKVRIFADSNAELTNALGVQLDLSAVFGVTGERMRRFSAYVVDSEIKVLNLEEGGALSCSLAPSLLSQI